MAEAAKNEVEPAQALAGGTAQPPKTLYCSFCFKSQHEVRKLIGL